MMMMMMLARVVMECVVLQGSRRNNVAYIAPNILIHACGDIVHFLNLETNSQTFQPVHFFSSLSLSPCLLSSFHHTHVISMSLWILETLLSLHEKSEHRDAFNIKALVLTNLHWTLPMSAVFFLTCQFA
jgi:hypothetical protein